MVNSLHPNISVNAELQILIESLEVAGFAISCYFGPIGHGGHKVLGILWVHGEHLVYAFGEKMPVSQGIGLLRITDVPQYVPAPFFITRLIFL